MSAPAPPPDPQFLALQSALAGRYSLEHELGRGGMGVVYLARDVALDRPVAIKLLPPALSADASARERFLREARTAAGLSHPNVVPIHLVEERDGLCYFVMGFVEGETLGQRVRRAGPLPVGEAVRIIREVAWALAYAHGRGVVHRDIKPDNVLVEKGTGRAMVTDFGIARVATLETVSQEGEIVGSFPYMAPEQADRTVTLDGRADQYALGVTAFYALTGRLPFDGGTAVALLAQHLTQPAPPVASMGVSIPAAVAAAVDRCLAKDPNARFPRAETLAEALGDAVPAAKPIPPSALEVRDALVMAYSTFGLSTIALLFVGSLQPDVVPPVAGVLGALLGLQSLGVLRAVSGAARAGLTSRDFRDSMIALESGEDANTRITHSEMQKLRSFFAKPVGRILLGAGGLLFTLAGFWASEFPIRAFRDLPAGDVWFTLFGGVLTVGFGLSALAGAFGRGPIRLLDPEIARATKPKLTGWFADNPLMRLLFRLARRDRPATRVVANQATEALLGRAAQELLEGLAPAARRQLKGAEQAIRQLEAAAHAQRARRDSLDRALAEVGQGGDTAKREALAGELRTARDRAADQLQSAMTALENLRLDLLRARAGVGAPADLTGAINAARRIGDQIAATLESERL
ncbi:MAG: serine/threonine protein kinase [Gemmatimonadetes bacterium]|nr:serine/threonine protein kinase [Gemmatimonadota bacterium]